MTFAKNVLTTTVLVALAACAKAESHARPVDNATSTAPAFVAETALDRWVASLRSESPECKIEVKVLVADDAQVSLEPMHPITRNEAPRQLPTVHYFFVQPFVEDSEVAARREAQQKRTEACIADAGPGPHHKGRDMNVESCAITSTEGSPIPNAHLDRDLSARIPAYFSPPPECEKAAAAIQAQLTPYR